MRQLLKPFVTILCLMCLFGTAAHAKIKFKHYLRFEYEGAISYGELKAGWVYELSAAPYAGGKFTGNQYKPTTVKLLPAVKPATIYFANGATENTPKLIPARETITSTDPLHYAPGIVIVMGKDATQISDAEAPDYIFGITVANNFSNGFSSVGPVIVNGINFDKLYLESRLNGDMVQSGTTANMPETIATIVSNVSHKTNLKAGDVIFTIPLLDSAPIQIGDKIVVTLEGIGGLANKVISPN